MFILSISICKHVSWKYNFELTKIFQPELISA